MSRPNWSLSALAGAFLTSGGASAMLLRLMEDGRAVKYLRDSNGRGRTRSSVVWAKTNLLEILGYKDMKGTITAPTTSTVKRSGFASLSRCSQMGGEGLMSIRIRRHDKPTNRAKPTRNMKALVSSIQLPPRRVMRVNLLIARPPGELNA